MAECLSAKPERPFIGLVLVILGAGYCYCMYIRSYPWKSENPVAGKANRLKNGGDILIQRYAIGAAAQAGDSGDLDVRHEQR